MFFLKQSLPLWLTLFPHSDSRLRKVFETNLFGPVNLTRSLLPHFREKPNGVLLFMSSIGAYGGAVGAGAYSATKGALESKCLLSSSYLVTILASHSSIYADCIASFRPG